MTAVNPPPIMWAQRHGAIFLTVCLEDCKSPEIRIEPNQVYFKGTGGTDKKEHEVTIELFKEVDPEKSLKAVRDRIIEIMLKKKEDTSGYWPQLTKEKKKFHWLKVDFNRWQDEEDSDDEVGGGGDLEEMMRSMGGLGCGHSKQSFDDLDPLEDSDDEDIPDLE